MGSTGQLAFLTFFLNFAGSSVRLWTVFVESDNFMFRLPYITGFCLNVIIILQFAIYWNAPVPVKDGGKKDASKPKKKVAEAKQKVQ
mmetsp:Transcript_29922/g.45762  ORF Transcript_29922/g.45762 Transcript_29922/m.45762 type:complete len:87 (-) Transcript_29922:26-286(-)